MSRRGKVIFVCLLCSAAGMFPRNPVAGKETKPGALHGAAALEQLKHEGQYESLRAAMKEARFSVSRTANSPIGRPAWHAPNPAAAYDAYVTDAGVSIAAKGESFVSLRLHSLGYGAALQPVASGEISGDKQTIIITRDGGLREWYINGPDGLEQGFTLARAPASCSASQTVELRLRIQGDLRPVLTDNRQTVEWINVSGVRVLLLDSLKVRDAAGRVMTA